MQNRSSMQVIRLSLECCSDVQRSTCLVSHSFPSVTVFQDQLCDPFEHGVLRFAPSTFCSSCRREAHHEPAEAQHHEPAQAQLHVSFSPHCCPWGNTPHCQDEEELPEASEVRGPSGLSYLSALRCRCPSRVALPQRWFSLAKHARALFSRGAAVGVFTPTPTHCLRTCRLPY